MTVPLVIKIFKTARFIKCLERSLQYVRNFIKFLNLIKNLKAEQGIEPITFAMKRCDAMQTGLIQSSFIKTTVYV